MLEICPVSGGKDSQATAIWCVNNKKPVQFMFNDVKWEAKETYLHLEYMEAMLGQKFIVTNSNRGEGLAELAIRKNMFPSTSTRFCTEELKVKPTIDWILAQTDDITIYQGQRADESLARRSLKPNDEYFKYYVEPYKYRGKFDKDIRALEKQIKLQGEKAKQPDLFSTGPSLLAQLKELQEKNRPTLRPVFFSYRRKDVLAWLEKYSCDAVRPILTWTREDVFSYIAANGQLPNPMYKRGFSRVGCYPCIMCTLGEIELIATQDPERIEEISRIEEENNLTFFPTEYIPQRFCTKEVTRINKKTGLAEPYKVSTIKDVVNYVINHRKKGKEKTAKSCGTTLAMCE